MLVNIIESPEISYSSANKEDGLKKKKKRQKNKRIVKDLSSRSHVCGWLHTSRLMIFRRFPISPTTPPPPKKKKRYITIKQ